MTNDNNAPKKKESLVDKIVRIVLRKKSTSKTITSPTQTPISSISKGNINPVKTKLSKKGKWAVKTIKRKAKTKKSKKATKKKLKNKKQPKKRSTKKKLIKQKVKKNKFTPLPIKSSPKVVKENTLSQTPLPIYSAQEGSKSDSTFTEIEEEALKTKNENEIKEEIKNSSKENEMIKELGEKVSLNIKTTDFDRVLNAVQKYGSVEAAKLRKELNIPEKQFAMCYAILQKNGEIKVEYPLIGRMKLVAVKKKKSDE